MSWQSGGRKPANFKLEEKVKVAGFGPVIVSIFLLLLIIGCFDTRAAHAEPSSPAADSLFKTVWSEADGPIVADEATRSWLWGPGPFSSQTEQYQEGPEGSRPVQYFDKGRMELTRPDTRTVTLGLLVYEMI